MHSPDRFDPDRLLDEIVVALRDEKVPDFVDPFETDSKPSRLERDHRHSHTNAFGGGRLSLTQFGIAAIIVVIFIFFNFPNEPVGTQKVAFAQVQNAVLTSKTVRFRFLDFHGDQDPSVTSLIWASKIGSRHEGPDGSISITNLPARKSLWILPWRQTAEISQLYFDSEEADDFFEATILKKILNLPASGAKNLGSADFNGRKVLKFSFTMAGEFIAFVDPVTKLPIRLEFTGRSPGGSPFRELVTDFEFDVPVEESLFELKIPDGYAVSICEEPKDRKPIDTKRLMLSRENGFGPIRLRSSFEQVLDAFGTPDKIEKTRIYGVLPQASPTEKPVQVAQREIFSRSLQYPSLGFSIEVIDGGGVRTISCYGRTSNGPAARDFLGMFDGNIMLGASIDDVLKVHGKPTTRSSLREDVFRYPYKGMEFVFCDGKLISFSMSIPTSEEFEILDNGDGTWTTKRRPEKKP